MTLAGEDPANYEPLIVKKNDGTPLSKNDIKLEIKKRLTKLNQLICDKISKNFTSVNKAFLTLDMDHDGWIEPKDIVNMYGTHL